MTYARSIPSSAPPVRRRGRAVRALALSLFPWVARVAPIGATLGPAGCIGACDLAGCSAGFAVLVDGGEGMDERLESAVYVVEAEADGGVFEVECTFDDEGQGQCGDGQWTTEPPDDLEARVSLESSDEYDESRGMAISIHFEANSPARHGVNQFGPEMVDVTVRRDGMVMALGSFAPEYAVQEDFNGEGCGDCAFAESERLHAGG